MGTLLRTALHFLLALCAAGGMIALIGVLATGLIPNPRFTGAAMVLVLGGTLLLSGLSAGSLLGYLLESRVPLWWAAGFGVVVGSSWLLGFAPESETRTEPLEELALKVLPPLTFAIGCVTGAAISKRLRDRQHRREEHYP